jgi:hypothetical protein
MNTELSAKSSSQPIQPLDLSRAIEASMKRLLGVNDGYGSKDLRVYILDTMMELSRTAELSDGFVNRITDGLRSIDDQMRAPGWAFRPKVMREAISTEVAHLTGFAFRVRDASNS